VTEQIINIERMEQIINIFGSFDENIRLIENEYRVKISNRGSNIKILGELEDTMRAEQAIESLIILSNRGETINEQNVRYVMTLVNEGKNEKISELSTNVICITAKGRPIKTKTIGQANYVEAIKKNTIVLSIGPAGTGKTYIAVAMAVAAFRNRDVNKIILTRPAVEAGENLGFLPGDLLNKIDPYLRPLNDALFDMLGPDTYQKYVERGNIEVAPLAYMRGRTLDDAFIILDEAQNTTPVQMKMFLTRLGFNSKIVITGDITQIDLPFGSSSGLIEASKILEDVEGIEIVWLTEKDVVRHQLVQKIIKAYEKYESNKEDNKNHGQAKGSY
jgi:phosphate starvation-inducible PhoH-like protein